MGSCHKELISYRHVLFSYFFIFETCEKGFVTEGFVTEIRNGQGKKNPSMGAKHLFLDSCLFCFLSPTRHPLPAEYSKITQSLLPWFLQPPFPPFLQLRVLRPLRDTDATDAGVWLIGAS